MKLRAFFTYLLLIPGTILFLSPLYEMLTMSFKTPHDVAATSVWALPPHFTFDNYKEVFNNPNVSFGLFTKNSLFLSVVCTLGVIVTASMTAYAFARLKFPGRDKLFIVLLSTMMLPGVATMVPNYVIFAKMHWVNTFLPLTIPAWLGGGAFNIFLLRQFFMNLPRDLDEAAILDGATNGRIFWQILLPLSGPALATVGVFTFIGTWRDFVGPLIYLNDPDKQTLEVGLSTFQGLQQEQWHLIMAGSTMVMLPLIVIFLLGQRYFVKGISMTGLK